MLVAAALALAAACGANTTQLTPAQEAYLKSHPERGPRDRNALLYRTIKVGDPLEWVKIAWDGVAIERVHGGGIAETWRAHVAVDARPVTLVDGAREEEVPRGTVLLTFSAGKLAGWVKIE
jgi:hypothetical protein